MDNPLRFVRTQEFFHWLEEGGGMWLASRAALVLGLLALSLFYGCRRLEGPPNESVLERLVVTRQVADGKGLSTGVIHPQAVAKLEERGTPWKPGQPMPELYQPPLYSWLSGKILGLMPAGIRESVWKSPEMRGGAGPTRFGGDLAMFWINWIGLVALVVLVYRLASSWFNPRAGLVAALGMATAQGFWTRVLELGGVVLPALLLVGVALLVFGFERAREAAMEAEDDATPGWGRQYARVAGVGVLLGLLALSEYAALWLVPGVILWLAASGKGAHRATLPLVALVCFAVVSGPWWVRNVNLTGHPLALAGQALLLKTGDTTADPETFRATLAAAAPEFSFRKVVGKGLAVLEDNLSGRLWREGGGFLLAFLAAGLLHTFRRPEVNRTRWVLVGLGLLVLIGAGFTSDGREAVPVAAWVAPLWIAGGAGFLVLLAESGGRSLWAKRGWISLAVFLHALPLLHGLAAPPANPFHFPPYLPHVAAVINNDIIARHPNLAAMSDRPAGLAWYGATPAWNQPSTYRDFLVIHLRHQEVAVLYLTPARLDEPFYSKLAAPTEAAAGSSDVGDWAQVYRGLAGRGLPSFFPLPHPLALGRNIFVLVKSDLAPQGTPR